jgi:hypothetical protein
MSKPSYRPVSLWECQCCGQAVECRETHDAWHAYQEWKYAGMIYTTMWPSIHGRARLIDQRAPHLGWLLEVTNDRPKEFPTRYESIHASGATLEQAWAQLARIAGGDP